MVGVIGLGEKASLMCLIWSRDFLERRLFSVSIIWGRALEPKHVARTEGGTLNRTDGIQTLVFPHNRMISTLYPHDHGIWEELSDGGCPPPNMVLSAWKHVSCLVRYSRLILPALLGNAKKHTSLNLP